MAKVTSKLQVTLPKALAAQYGIHPGDDIDWQPAGDAIRVVPRGARVLTTEERLRQFKLATERIAQRKHGRRPSNGRGWTREELYVRGRPR